MRRLSIVLLLVAVLFAAPQLHAQESDTVVLRSDDETVVNLDSIDAPDATSVETVTDEYTDEDDTVYQVTPPSGADLSPIATRPLSGQQMDESRKDDDFWYWNYREKKQRPKTRNRPSQDTSWSFPSELFWILVIVGFLVLLHFLLLSMNINVFARSSMSIQGEEEEEEVEDIFNRNYEREVAQALASGDHRLAIRLRYLQLLRELSDRNIIQYRAGATNGVYVSQLWGTAYYTDFFRATRTFEYAWYGMLHVPEAAYHRMQEDIAHLKTRVA
ncbi:MAG: DUF4129 domain-containing protein [Chitinophagaceae bacterium]|nr:MAG: DUF4129 domain-containing protein [Chitinophagaceae bacterium]